MANLFRLLAFITLLTIVLDKWDQLTITIYRSIAIRRKPVGFLRAQSIKDYPAYPKVYQFA